MTNKALLVNLSLLFLLLSVYAENESSEVPVVETVEGCVYGVDNKDMTLGNLVARTISLNIVCGLAFIGVTLVGGSVVYLFFSLPGFAFAAGVGCIVTDLIARRWQTWRYFGPGEAFIDGNGNRMVFVTHVIRATCNKIIQLVATMVLTRYAFLMEENRVPRWLTAIRCLLGVLAALGMSAMSAFYAFTRGVPSFYRGFEVMNRALMTCSGAMRWNDLAGYVRFNHLVGLIVPFCYLKWYFGLPLSFVVIVCSSITIGRGWNRYHQVSAVMNLIVYIPTLVVALGLFIQSRKGGEKGGDEMEEAM